LKTFPFTSDVRTIKEALKSLYASGGGDGPEASTAAMGELLSLDWRPGASKMSVLITDAPPHVRWRAENSSVPL
jgi:Mg-chelatase subunit ChlD